MSKVLCLFHRDCIDGYAAAWVVGYACGFENVEFVPVNHGQEWPDLTGREVYVVDFMPNSPADLSSETLKSMAQAKRLVILDHHEGPWTNWKDVPLLEHWSYRYEPNLSGVGVAWRWFFGGNHEMPRALQLIQDRDLWLFQMTGSREFHEVAISHGLLADQPKEDSWLGRMVNYEIGMCRDLNDLMPEIHTEGQAILRAQKQQLQTLLKRARVVSVAGYEVPLCQVPYDLRSEAGFWLSLKYPFSVTYDDIWSAGIRKYSIRSNKKTGINVIPIAEAFGGSGHKHAAAFNQPVDEQLLFRLPSWGVQLKLEFEEPT